MINHIGSNMLILKKYRDIILIFNYLNYLKQKSKLTVKMFNKEMIFNNKSYNPSNNKDPSDFLQYNKIRKN